MRRWGAPLDLDRPRQALLQHTHRHQREKIEPSSLTPPPASAPSLRPSVPPSGKMLTAMQTTTSWCAMPRNGDQTEQENRMAHPAACASTQAFGPCRLQGCCWQAFSAACCRWPGQLMGKAPPLPVPAQAASSSTPCAMRMSQGVVSLRALRLRMQKIVPLLSLPVLYPDGSSS